MDTKRTDNLLEEAARWVARLGAADLSGQERDELQQWLRADPAHSEAFTAAQLVAKGVSQLSKLDDRLTAMADEAYAMGDSDGRVATSPRRARQPRWLIPAGAAAGLALVMAVGLRVVPKGEPAPEPAKVYAAGERLRQVLLEDGSRVSLDMGSRVSVSFADKARRLELISGRALFDVAHDSRRPFSVTANGVTTTALGTRFQVDRGDEAEVTVFLSQGSVKVEQVAGTSAPARSERLVPGEQLSVAGGGWKRSTVDTDVATSWSRGRLVFRATPLAQAVAEINRHAPVRLVLGDPALAQFTVNGNFIPGDSGSIASAFEAALPLRAVESGGEIVLFLRHGTEDVDG